MPLSKDPDAWRKRRIIEDRCRLADQTAVFPMDRLAALPPEDFHIRDALEELRRTALVIADVSFERPSCYYELGLAEALGRPIALIAMTGTDIHQTSSRSRVRFYSDLNEYAVLVKDALGTVRSKKGP